MPVQELTFKVNVTSAQAQAEVRRLVSSVNSEIKKINQNSAQEVGKLRNVFASEFQKIASQVPVVGTAFSGITDKAGELSSTLASVGSVAGTAGAEIAAMAGPIGIAVAGTAALVVGAAALTKGLVDLGIAAADAQGKLFDLSQQTGVSVETLSALDLLAKQTGGNIESLSQSLVVFQGNMEEAQDPTSKQAKLFGELNVTITDTEETLRQTLSALAKMPVGFEQTNRAAELFGRRGGKQFLAILKEAHGDIDKTILELQRFGLANSENAKRADELNDQIVRLQTQLTGLQVTLGNQVIPALTDALKDLEKFVNNNKEAIDALATSIKFVAGSISGQLKLALLLITPQLKAQEAVIKGIADNYERLAAVLQLVSGRIPQVNPNAIPVQPLAAPESGQALLDLLDKARRDREAASQFGLKPFNLEDIFGLKKKGAAGGLDPAAQLLKQLQSELRNLEGATKAETIAAELLDTKYKNISASLKEQILLVARLIDEKHVQQQADEELKRAQEELKRAQDEAARSIGDFIRQQAEDLDQLRGITKSAADEAEEFIKEIGKVPGVLREADKSWIRFRATLIDSENHLRTIRDLLKDIADQTPPIAPNGIGNEAIPNVSDILAKQGVVAPEEEKRFKGLQSALDDLGKSLADLTGASADFGKQFGDVVGGAIDQTAFAIGDLVNQWVLLGDTGPAAMRRLTASVLAGLAAQAAVKAIFQLAEGFAALFFNPAEAAAHFTSAALFGSIAGAAAIAGRAVAGDTFRQPTSQGGQGSGREGNGQINPVTLERNRGQQPVFITVKVQQDRHSIVDVFAQDFRAGGLTRELVNNDGGVRA